jgi:hypothetical protein
LHSAQAQPAADIQCSNIVDPHFYASMTEFIPVLILALGMEFNYVRRTDATQAPIERAAPILTVILLCIAQILAFSAMVRPEELCGAAGVWHRYIALAVTVQAAAIGLATMVWLLRTSALREESDGNPPPAQPNTSAL